MTKDEALKLALEALENTTPTGFNMERDKQFFAAITAIKEALAQPEQEPVAWRDHVEQRLLTWRQSFVNRSGDQLALDDFMDKRSLDDLVEFVCDEYATPPQPEQSQVEETLRYEIDALETKLAECRAQQLEPVIDKSAAVRIATALGWTPQRKPLTDEEITEAIRTSSLYMKPSPHTPQSIWLALLVGYARAIEAKLKEKNT